VRVKVLFFGTLKDITGRAQDALELNEGATAGSVFEHYAGRFPPIAALSDSIVIARNHTFAPRSTPVAEGDEIALLPPVSGGCEWWGSCGSRTGTSPSNARLLTRAYSISSVPWCAAPDALTSTRVPEGGCVASSHQCGAATSTAISVATTSPDACRRKTPASAMLPLCSGPRDATGD